MKLIKIPKKKLKHMKSLGFKELIPYTHKNPLVNFIFWLRFKTLLDLANPAKRVLDFGSGSGVFLPSLSKNFKEVYSLDRDNIKSLKYIKKMYKLSNVKIKKNEGTNLPFKNNFFDIIFAADVLEHFKDLDLIEILKEFKRVLKKQGVLIVSGPSENLIYRISRKILFRYKKPKDHYTNIDNIIIKSKKFFKIEEIKKLPPPLMPSFKIYRAKNILD